MNEEKTYEQGFEDGKREVLRQINALAAALVASSGGADLHVGASASGTWLVHADLPGHKSSTNLLLALRDAAAIQTMRLDARAAKLRAALGEP